MTQEFSDSPEKDRGEPVFPGKGESKDSADEARVIENLRRISAFRTGEEKSPEQLKELQDSYRSELEEILKNEKELRIEKAKNATKRDRLRSWILELQRERLEKNSRVSELRTQLRAERDKLGEGSEGELRRLEIRKAELTEDVTAFTETFIMHRNDRDRAFLRLSKAQASLQDLLTEEVLWKIMDLSASEPANERGRTGKSGLLAELLGRILVLEKEEAQITGLLVKGKIG